MGERQRSVFSDLPIGERVVGTCCSLLFGYGSLILGRNAGGLVRCAAYAGSMMRIGRWRLGSRAMSGGSPGVLSPSAAAGRCCGVEKFIEANVFEGSRWLTFHCRRPHRG